MSIKAKRNPTQSRGNGMKSVFAAAVTIVLVVFLTGCSTQATQQNGNLETEFKALSLENHNMDVSFAARPEQPLTAKGAAAEVRELDEEIVAYQNIFEREHALLAKYHKELLPETVTYETAKLRYVRAVREFYSYLAETGFGHGSNFNRSEYQRIKKASDEALVEEQQAANALHRAKEE
jgi:hypothetical protein